MKFRFQEDVCPKQLGQEIGFDAGGSLDSVADGHVRPRYVSKCDRETFDHDIAFRFSLSPRRSWIIVVGYDYVVIGDRREGARGGDGILETGHCSGIREI